MTRKVKAYGQVFAFPADMSNDAIAKVLLSKRKELDPTYKESFTDKVLGSVRDSIKDIFENKSIAERAEETALDTSNVTASQIKGAPVRQSTYNQALLNDNFLRRPDKTGILSRIRNTADADVKGKERKKNLQRTYKEAPTQQELDVAPETLDYLKGFAVGSNELLGGAGWVAEKVGADNVGKKLGEMRDVGVKYWKDSMTLQGKKAMEANVVEDDLSLGDHWGRALGMNITKSLPAMIATAPIGGVLSKGIQTVAKALGAGGATSALLAGTAAPVGVTSNIIARVPTAIGFGAAEGLGAGAQNAAAFKKQIIGMPEKELEKSPRYQSLKAEHGAMKARMLLADEASTELFQNTALSTGAIGALTGGGALGQAYQKITTGTSSGLVKETAKGIFGETIQEAPQSGAEQFLSNLATKDYLDPTQDLSKGVASATATGALVGGATGGLFGAGGAINVTSKDYQQKAHEVAGAINEEIITKDVANIASAPTVEDAIAATTQAVSRKPITKDTVLSTVDPTLKDLTNTTGLTPTEILDYEETAKQTEETQSSRQDAGLLSKSAEAVMVEGDASPIQDKQTLDYSDPKLKELYVNLKIQDEAGATLDWKGNPDKHPGRTQADVALNDVQSRIDLLNNLRDCLNA